MCAFIQFRTNLRGILIYKSFFMLRYDFVALILFRNMTFFDMHFEQILYFEQIFVLKLQN